MRAERGEGSMGKQRKNGRRVSTLFIFDFCLHSSPFRVGLPPPMPPTAPTATSRAPAVFRALYEQKRHALRALSGAVHTRRAGSKDAIVRRLLSSWLAAPQTWRMLSETQLPAALPHAAHPPVPLCEAQRTAQAMRVGRDARIRGVACDARPLADSCSSCVPGGGGTVCFSCLTRRVHSMWTVASVVAVRRLPVAPVNRVTWTINLPPTSFDVLQRGDSALVVQCFECERGEHAWPLGCQLHIHERGRRRLCYLEHRTPFESRSPESNLVTFEFEWDATAALHDVVWAIAMRSERACLTE